MSRQLPARPNIEYHKNAAKALLKARRKGDIVANERVSGAHPRGASVDVTLRDAQWVIAREHGFATWAEFREHVVGCERRAVPDVASDAISSVLDITPEWLTRRLQGNGYLPRGRVSAVEVVSRDTPRSGVDRIAIAYTSDAPTAPARLLLKRTGGGDGATEVGFYTDIAPRMGVASTPVCYDAGIDHETRQAYVLVADHLDTHFLYRAPEHLAAPALESVVEELARIQAFWWDNERIHQNHYRNPMMMEADTPQALHRCCARLLDRAVPRFFDGPAVGAPPEWRGLCESAIAAWPAHMNE
ncbi:hypothetical protein HOK31_26745, partial [Candidatus Poribacteria bacterium]|nr:hypothetical protein [Candidatus Poribacteria bacterium]